MLDYGVSTHLNEPQWSELALRAMPPEGEAAYMAAHEDAPLAPSDDRRSHRRIVLRERALLRRRGEWLAGYVHDLSARGLGVYAPVQLFPNQRATVVLDDSYVLEFEVRRCRRLARDCYLCGGGFVAGPLSPKILAEIAKTSRFQTM
jgi:hypothetical protein